MAVPVSLAVRLISPEDTARLAATIAPLLAAGDVLLLWGDLGAGKTHFARALIQARLAARGLHEEVPSPTFTLVQVYDDADAEIWHCDLYRLSGPQDVVELGLEEAFRDAICLVEWPDRLGNLAPAGALSLRLSRTERPGERVAVFESPDPRWRGILARATSGAAHA